MANSLVQKLTMSEMKERIGNLAQTNYYYVELGISNELQNHFKTSYGGELTDIGRFVNRLGYLCSEASLPTTSYATAEVKDNFMGVTQEFAHTRLYTDIDLTFYVDAEYNVLRFFEGWMDYIAGGNKPKEEPAASSYPSGLSGSIYRRFNYPKFYKMNTMKIYKFERDYKKQLEYTFINAFPKSLSTVAVSYGPADILKATVTFNFDRYLVQRSDMYQEPEDTSKIQNPTSGNSASNAGLPADPKLQLQLSQSSGSRSSLRQDIFEIQQSTLASILRQQGYNAVSGGPTGVTVNGLPLYQ